MYSIYKERKDEFIRRKWQEVEESKAVLKSPRWKKKRDAMAESYRQRVGGWIDDRSIGGEKPDFGASLLPFSPCCPMPPTCPRAPPERLCTRLPLPKTQCARRRVSTPSLGVDPATLTSTSGAPTSPPHCEHLPIIHAPPPLTTRVLSSHSHAPSLHKKRKLHAMNG